MDILQHALKALVSDQTVYFALLAVGVNIQFGYAGLLNFGQVAFAMVGAFGVASTVARFGGGYWLGILVGLAAAVVLAVLLGLPTLRLRADYLAIVTIATAEILRTAARSVHLDGITGSTQGLNRYAEDFYALNPITAPEFRVLGVRFGGREAWALIVGWALVALACLLVWAVARSPFGRVLRAIREDEDAARSLGKNVYWYKTQVLLIGGVIGAVAGIWEATESQATTAETYQSAVTFFAYAAVILGGSARVLGPVAGSVLFWVLFSVTEDLLHRLVDAHWIPARLISQQSVDPTRFILVGIVLMLLMAFRPQGLLGDRREVTIDAR